MKLLERYFYYVFFKEIITRKFRELAAVRVHFFLYFSF